MAQVPIEMGAPLVNNGIFDKMKQTDDIKQDFAMEPARFDKNGFITTERGKQIIKEDGLSLMDAGRGVLSGYVKCSLSNVKSKRRYALGR